MHTPDIELIRRLRRASIKARFGGLGFVLMGAMFLTFGYFGSRPSQREFNERMNSRSTPLDSTIDKVPPLAAGRALSTPLMSLMPLVMFGLGLLSVGMGAKTIAQGASPEERQDIAEEYRIERLMQERRGIAESSLNSIVDGLLRHDGVYVRAQGSDFDWKYLIFESRFRLPP